MPRHLVDPSATPGVPAVTDAHSQPIDIGSRLELFVDRHLVQRAAGVQFVLHRPVRQPLDAAPLPVEHMMSIHRVDGGFRAYYRGLDPAYTGERYSGHPGETVAIAESADGRDWTLPRLGLHEIDGSKDNNTLLAKMSPWLTNFMPFLDTRPGVPADERWKALAGYPGDGDKRQLKGEALRDRGLFAFVSADGLTWKNRGEVIPYQAGWRHAFDSPNVGFWSEAEGRYVCYFRVWTEPGPLRSIGRVTSPDFLTWDAPVAVDPNLEGEHLYTSMTTPYFRAPHIYLAFPTRFITQRGMETATDATIQNLTDVMFMSCRAGSQTFDRPFRSAFIRPGLDPAQWTNRANYVAHGIVPTSPQEISIYHRSGHRYTLRTDGFVSATADADPGELITRPIVFAGKQLALNFSTTAGGDLRVELLDDADNPIPGFALADCPLIIGDRIDHAVMWTGNPDLSALAGRPVRLRFVMKECDLFSYRFH